MKRGFALMAIAALTLSGWTAMPARGDFNSGIAREIPPTGPMPSVYDVVFARNLFVAGRPVTVNVRPRPDYLILDGITQTNGLTTAYIEDSATDEVRSFSPEMVLPNNYGKVAAISLQKIDLLRANQLISVPVGQILLAPQTRHAPQTVPAGVGQ